MYKFNKYAILVFTLSLFGSSFSLNNSVAYSQEVTTVSEEAQMLYDDAIELKKKGNTKDAIVSYVKALRKDRTILAYDDNGLISAAYDDSVAKLKESPEDIKLLEVCGFLSSVGFSDNETAIKYYNKIIELVDDPKIKDRTQNLVDRLVATNQAQQEFDRANAVQDRDERVKFWAEMEKADNFSAEQERAAEVSGRLNDAYASLESLQNKVPQMEQELSDLKESYEKADRLWYTLKDELYERRRRRLKNEIAAKESELESAKKELKKAEKEVENLEKEDEKIKQDQENSTFNEQPKDKADDDSEDSDEDSAFNENKNDYSDEPSDEYKDDESHSKKIDELIDDL